MRNNFFIFLLLFQIQVFAQGCYSIKTDVGTYTPVFPITPLSFKTCHLKELSLDFDMNNTYIGCYKYKKTAIKRYKNLQKQHFVFKNAKIIKHTPSKYTTFVIFPNFYYKTKIYLQNQQKKFLKALNNYTPTKIDKLFPTHFYGNGISFEKITKLSFLPIPNVYSIMRYYNQHHLSTKTLVLYRGVYSIEYLYKKINNPNIIEKQNQNSYIIKVPIYISPTASLVIQNKTIKLETLPKPIIILYNGNLFIKNSNIITWNLKTNSYAKREKIKNTDMLLLGKQTPRPYFLGMARSKTIMLNSSFRGLGFHDLIGTFGISLKQFPLYKFHNSELLNKLSKIMPSGIFVGNNIYDCMIGFYTSNAKNVVFVGNYVHNNIIYDVDPHDYSKNLLIARNLLSDAYHAHGVVMSRGVKDSFIAQNISLNNHSDGIMLDRSCYNNIIYNNLTFYNGIAGISIQESDGNLINDNIIANNINDGIIARNSINIKISHNYIYHNGKNGIEITTKNINDTLYRNFARDPYHMASSAVVWNNTIKNNLTYQITVKQNSAISLYGNSFDKKDMGIFGNNLSLFLNKITQNHNFKLYGLGNPYKGISTDFLKIHYPFNEIFIDLYKYNPYSASALARIYYQFTNKNNNLYKNQLLRQSSNLSAMALLNYGIKQLSFDDTNKTKILNNLSFVVESAIMGNTQASHTLLEVRYLFPITKKDINKAYKIAKHRMMQGRLFPKNYSPIVCKTSKQQKQYIKSLFYIFRYKMKINYIDSFYHFLLAQDQNYSPLPHNIAQLMDKRYKKANYSKLKYHNYLKQKYARMEKFKTCRRYLFKSEFYQKESSKIIKKYTKQDIQTLKPKFIYFLKLINKYRSKNKQIGFDEIIQIINRGQK